MKPTLEKIDPIHGGSFFIRKFEQQFLFNDPVWHFHPEYEIVYVSNGRGKRHIGNHISHYYKGDLIMLGPNLPHFGFTQEQQKGHFEIVVQMREDFLGEDFLSRPEMLPIRQLFERARTGLAFQGETKRNVGRRLHALHDASPFKRLVGLLEVLHEMASSEEVESLNANGFTVNVTVEDETRIQQIYQYVQAHFKRHITLDEISEVANMTVPAFCRYFKKLTNQTFTRFVNEFRVAHATKLLVETDALITEVAHESGFNNISHFNKHFLKVTGLRPSEYRHQAERVLTVAGDVQ
ncbi:MAG: AraC family transcriptional regulator [Saprospiraceae bacterium]|nr:AraC family transcriptional regulator [Saprospiraceae bacterium]